MLRRTSKINHDFCCRYAPFSIQTVENAFYRDHFFFWPAEEREDNLANRLQGAGEQRERNSLRSPQHQLPRATTVTLVHNARSQSEWTTGPSEGRRRRGTPSSAGTARPRRAAAASRTRTTPSTSWPANPPPRETNPTSTPRRSEGAHPPNPFGCSKVDFSSSSSNNSNINNTDFDDNNRLLMTIINYY